MTCEVSTSHLKSVIVFKLKTKRVFLCVQATLFRIFPRRSVRTIKFCTLDLSDGE